MKIVYRNELERGVFIGLLGGALSGANHGKSMMWAAAGAAIGVTTMVTTYWLDKKRREARCKKHGSNNVVDN